MVTRGETPLEVLHVHETAESFLARANGNDNIRREVEQCGGDTACVAKVGLRHGHKFSAANYTRWQREHK